MQAIELIINRHNCQKPYNVLTFNTYNNRLLENIQNEDLEIYLWEDQNFNNTEINNFRKVSAKNLDLQRIDVILVTDITTQLEIAYRLSTFFHCNIVIYVTTPGPRLPILAFYNNQIEIPNAPFVTIISSSKEIAKNISSNFTIERASANFNFNFPDKINTRLVLHNGFVDNVGLEIIKENVKDLMFMSIDNYDESMGRPLCFLNMFNDYNEEVIYAMQHMPVISNNLQHSQKGMNFVDYFITDNSIQSIINSLRVIFSTEDFQKIKLTEKQTICTLDSFRYKWNNLIKYISSVPYRR